MHTLYMATEEIETALFLKQLAHNNLLFLIARDTVQ